MKAWIVFLSVMLAMAVAGAASAGECDDLYVHRARTPADAALAAECYAKLEVTSSNAERASIALTWGIRKSKSASFQLKLIARGLQLADVWTSTALPSATYWRSVFTTFEANHGDEGSPLPVNLLRALPKIKADLRAAVKASPDTHFHGPTRVLGVIDLSAPAIVGGDPKRAFALIGDALASSPKSTLNQLWYAKALIRLRREGEARGVLERIVQLPPADVDAEWIPETIEDQTEAAKILGSLK